MAYDNLSTRVAIAIMMDGISSINPPTQHRKAICQQYQWHIDYTIKVTKQLLHLCPIVFVGGFNSRREKCCYWVDVTSSPCAQEQQLSGGVMECKCLFFW
jgi:hypothetical protein